MISEKKSLMSYLKGLYKRDKVPELKGLIKELKKRTLGFYTRDDGMKSLVLVHKRLWCKNKMPRHEWPDYFTTWDDGDNNDLQEVLLLWVERLGIDPEGTTYELHNFLTDEEEDVTYIQ